MRFCPHTVISKLGDLALGLLLATLGTTLITHAAKAEIIGFTCSPGNQLYAINMTDNKVMYVHNWYDNYHTAMLPDGRSVHIAFAANQNLVLIIIEDLTLLHRTEIEIHRDTGEYTNTSLGTNISLEGKTSEFRHAISGSCVPTTENKP